MSNNKCKDKYRGSSPFDLAQGQNDTFLYSVCESALLCGRRRGLRSFAFRMKEVHEIFDFVGLENISEGRHGGAAIVNLMLDFFFV